MILPESGVGVGRRRTIAVGRRQETNSLGQNGDFGLRSGADGDGVVQNGRRNGRRIVDHDVKTARVVTTSAAHVLVLGERRGRN